MPLSLAFGRTVANGSLKGPFCPLLPVDSARQSSSTSLTRSLLWRRAPRHRSPYWPPPHTHTARPLLTAIVATENHSYPCLVPPLEIQIWQLHHPNFFLERMAFDEYVFIDIVEKYKTTILRNHK